MTGPDHAASLNPKELISMVKSIRATEIILGKSKKFVSKSEKKYFDSKKVFVCS